MPHSKPQDRLTYLHFDLEIGSASDASTLWPSSARPRVRRER